MKITLKKRTALLFISGTALIAGIYLIVRKKRKDANRTASELIANGTSPVNAGLSTKTQTGATKNNIFPVEYGDRGSSVSMLQQALNDLYGAGLQVDGIFGKKTLAACKQYLGVEKVTAEVALELARKQQQTGVSSKTNTQSTVSLPDLFI